MAAFVRNGKKARGCPKPKSNRPLIHSLQIVAIGRNYAAHAKELNNAVPKEPFFFLKPTSSYLPSGGKLEIPQGIVAHHEGMY
jgi:acylpyruvate hydrolase